MGFASPNGVLPRKGGLGTPPIMRCYCMAKVPDHNYGGCLWCQNKCIGTITGLGGEQGDQLSLWTLPCLTLMVNRVKATLEGIIGKSLYVMT